VVGSADIETHDRTDVIDLLDETLQASLLIPQHRRLK
jgi:hypothetical protein